MHWQTQKYAYGDKQLTRRGVEKMRVRREVTRFERPVRGRFKTEEERKKTLHGGLKSDNDVQTKKPRGRPRTANKPGNETEEGPKAKKKQGFKKKRGKPKAAAPGDDDFPAALRIAKRPTWVSKVIGM